MNSFAKGKDPLEAISTLIINFLWLVIHFEFSNLLSEVTRHNTALENSQPLWKSPGWRKKLKTFKTATEGKENLRQTRRIRDVSVDVSSRRASVWGDDCTAGWLSKRSEGVGWSWGTHYPQSPPQPCYWIWIKDVSDPCSHGRCDETKWVTFVI